MVLIYPAVWTLFEWIRGWFLTGFPWLNVGYSQIDAPLSGLAPVAGIYGVSLAASLSSALLLAAFAGGDGRIRGGFLTGIVGLWFVTALAGHIVWTHPTGAPLKASLIQGNIPQDIKWLPAMRQPTFDLYARLTREHLDSDLIIWPETALPSFYRHARSFLSALGDEARASNTEVLIGLVYQTPGTQRYYNSMVTIGNDEAMYYKHHLVPFTEYLPLKKVLVGLVDFLDVPMSDFSAGNIDQPPLKMAGQKVAVTICYEDVFGEEVIRALPEASLLVNVSNDAWFGESIAPQQHLQIARMRALESGRPLLRATNTGMTALVDARGDIQSQAPQFSEHVLSGYVQPMGGATPYIRMGNLPVLALIGLMSGAGTFLSRGSAANDHRHA